MAIHCPDPLPGPTRQDGLLDSPQHPTEVRMRLDLVIPCRALDMCSGDCLEWLFAHGGVLLDNSQAPGGVR
jgi:hypothetical protein